MTGSVKDACVLIHQLGETGTEDLTRLHGELCCLEERQLELDHKLRDAAVRLRFCVDQDSLLRAKAAELEYLAALDHLMTRTRAVGAKLLLITRRLHETGRAH
jgi:hypothetical protein